MKINLKIYFFILVPCVFQIICMKSSSLNYSNFPFLDGGVVNENIFLVYRYLLYWYFPIACLLLVLSDFMKGSLTHTYIPYLIRNDKRNIWIGMEYGKVIWIIVQLICTQLILSIFFSSNTSHPLNAFHVVCMLFAYMFTLFFLIILQIWLGLYIHTKIAYLIIQIYIVLPILIPIDNKFNYLFFSNYMMANRNGMSILENYSEEVISYPWAMLILIIALGMVLFLITKKIKKIDII